MRPEDRDDLHAMLLEVTAHFQELTESGHPGGTEPAEPLALSGDDLDDRRALAACADMALRAEPFCSCLIAEDDAGAVGYLAWHWGVYEIFPALFVAGLYTRPRVRGLGVGKALMAKAREIALARGASHMTWMVWRRNAPAIGFYGSLGAELLDDDRPMAWDLRTKIA